MKYNNIVYFHFQIDSEENSSQISQSINSFEQESICSVNIYESDKCLLLEDALFVSELFKK